MKLEFKGGGVDLTQKHIKCAGFSLIEVMISSIVLLIVCSGIMAGIISALKAQANASDYYRATCIARNRIQHAKTMSFNSYNSITENVERIDQDGVLCPTGFFWRTTAVTNAGSNVMSVTVQVWYSVRPEEMSAQPVTMETMIHTTMQL
jgi:Tfp pilus assembly protein PilV